MSFRDGKLVGIVGLKGQNSRRRRRDEVDGTKDKIFQKKSAAHSIRGPRSGKGSDVLTSS
jgi:hypothetical protein